MDRRQLAERLLWSMHGLPYIWGGDDPILGFDCSGLMIEVLKSVGLLPRSGDWTAQGLYTEFRHYTTQVPGLGCLVFWKPPGASKIIHVEMCLNDTLSMGASGGGSGTTDEEDAIQQNAYVKVRPFASRPHLFGFVDPFQRSP